MNISRRILRLRHASTEHKILYGVLVLAVILLGLKEVGLDFKLPLSYGDFAFNRTLAMVQPDQKASMLDSSAFAKASQKRASKRQCKVTRLEPNGSNAYELDMHDIHRGLVPACAKTADLVMFEIDQHSNLVRRNGHDRFWKLSHCFYAPFSRDALKPDFNLRMSRYVFKITANSTVLSDGVEDIYLWCTPRNKVGTKQIIYEDYLSIVRVRRGLESTLNSSAKKDLFSVAIFGLDSASHMSFRRFMPQTHEFIVNEIGGIEFHGFNSLGPGTLWSVFPLLAGQDLNEFRRGCWKNESGYFDNCPFIWKEFEARGYRTSYAEDDMKGSAIFNERPRKGFGRQPVHYDFRHVALQLDKPLRMHDTRWRDSYCYGARLSFQVIVERMVQVARAFSTKSFFHFSWTGSLTHNRNALSSLGDPILLRALQRMRNENLLENTILILVSDHGMRYGSLRQRTRQGLLEERLPLLYIVLPQKFQSKFPVAARNMRKNAQKLSSAFDVHATLQHLLTLNSDAELRKKKPVAHARASSLFLPISTHRTCEDLGLNFVYCACESRKRVSTRKHFIQRAAHRTLLHINTKLDAAGGKCAGLNLRNITRAYNTLVDYLMSDELARRGHYGSDTDVHKAMGHAYEIELETEPGGAVFSAAVVLSGKDYQEMAIMSITRISAYEDDGRCVDSKELRPFCHCVSQ